MYFLRTLGLLKFGKYYRRCFCANSSFDEVSIRNMLRQYVGDSNGDIGLQKIDENGHKIAVISVNNPTRKNALTGLMMVKLAEIVDDLETWTEGKGLVLHGVGNSFCSGAELSVVKQIATTEKGAQMCFLMQRTLTRLSRLPLISVAALQGRALGGGAELSTACDFILMSENSEICFVHSKMGVTTGWGGGTRLVNLVGPRKALELLLRCTKLDADSAIAYGLTDGKLSIEKDSVRGAIEWLLPYLDVPLPILRAMKTVIVAGSCFPPDESLTLERKAFAQVWAGKHHNEAIYNSVKHK